MMGKSAARQEFNRLRKDMDISKLKCVYCGSQAAHMHHIIPLSVGGDNRDSNLIPLCLECHGKIHNKRYNNKWKELQKIGIEKAKAEGRYRGGTKKKIDINKYKDLKQDYMNRLINKTEFSELLGVSRPTLNKILKEEEEYLKFWEKDEINGTIQ
jgi:hypothetical protein